MATPSNPGSSESAKMIGSSFSLVRYNNPVLIDKHPTPTHSPTESSNSEKSKTETEELLDSILPPREWEEEGQLWRQSVSSTPATRLDVINLQEQLDQKLQQRQARETGICQVRRELYAQCFDELIRQCTINCMERGLLSSPIAFGIRKALQAEQGKADMESNISILEDEKMELERKLADEKNHAEEINFLKRTNQQLKAQLEGIISQKK
ncbi:DNALI [Lepeophtheirus salmonis]|uniref:DNALI n=1 Tax=Lepeophtheirus salmonis TaxID=72036 RepID=A0A7R8CN66_LEPSM|nr:DNALI [Lepeophtheirus salmonis]CAF2869328.1 DNALI [Lepeophtheirus salmonis]